MEIHSWSSTIFYSCSTASIGREGSLHGLASALLFYSQGSIYLKHTIYNNCFKMTKHGEYIYMMCVCMYIYKIVTIVSSIQLTFHINIKKIKIQSWNLHWQSIPSSIYVSFSENETLGYQLNDVNGSPMHFLETAFHRKAINCTCKLGACNAWQVTSYAHRKQIKSHLTAIDLLYTRWHIAHQHSHGCITICRSDAHTLEIYGRKPNL